jgi:pheromone shutdown protein TraB
VFVQVRLIDRPVAITVARMWDALTIWDKLQISYSIVRESLTLPDDLKEIVEDLKHHDALTEAMVSPPCLFLFLSVSLTLTWRISSTMMP